MTHTNDKPPAGVDVRFEGDKVHVSTEHYDLAMSEDKLVYVDKVRFIAPAGEKSTTLRLDAEVAAATAALKARIAELEAKVAALTPAWPDEGTVWVSISRNVTTGKPEAMAWSRKPDADEQGCRAISLIRVPWKAGQFDK